MSILNSLQDKYQQYDWFHSVGMDKNRPVIYVKYLNSNIFNITSDLNSNVLLHFSGSLCQKDDYINNLSPLPNLKEELWNLKRICGHSNLISIFYESHDRDNAVTSISKDYPEVRKSMDYLYDIFGFDLIFEELEQ